MAVRRRSAHRSAAQRSTLVSGHAQQIFFFGLPSAFAAAAAAGAAGAAGAAAVSFLPSGHKPMFLLCPALMCVIEGRKVSQNKTDLVSVCQWCWRCD